MISQSQLLERAENEFLKGEYFDSLRSYGLLLNDYPLLEEARIGVFLSDLGSENDDEAQALFDYYQLIKLESKDAVEIIDGLIDSLDSSKGKIHELIMNPIEEQLEYGDGIRYSDFQELILSRGSFKKAFEDIMFSTKVIITQKDEFIDFVTQLSSFGFKSVALNYLDNVSVMFGDSQDVLDLYNVVNGEENWN